MATYAHRTWSIAFGLAFLLASTSAYAAVPVTVAIQGSLMSDSGGPVSDGGYLVTFALYASKASPKASWSEAVNVTVKSGRFMHALGSLKSLSNVDLDSAKSGWIGVKIGNEPELARLPLFAVLYARRSAVAEKLVCSGCVTAAHLAKDIFAGKLLTQGSVTADKVAFAWAKADKAGGTALLAKSADSSKIADLAKSAADLKCTGCVSVSELKIDGNLLLGKYGLTAAKVVASEVTAQQLVGDGSKITGIKMPQGKCKAGQAVAGIAPDGSLQCINAGGKLPNDGLSQVSNGLLSNVFEANYGITKPVAIPDLDPIGVSAQVAVPDHGLVKTLSVSVDIGNSDISGLTVVLYDPANNAYLLHDKSGTGKVLKATYPAPVKPKSGDLLTWLGKNPKGAWRLKVIDMKKAAGGNDGAINAFSVQVTWISSQKVAAKSAFVMHKAATPPFACDASAEGAMYYDNKLKRMRFCDGQVWRSLSDNCGNGVVEQGEQCDDGNNTDGDGCSSLCTTKCGDGKTGGAEECDDGNNSDNDGCSNKCVAAFGLIKSKPGASCKALKSAGLVNSGMYFIDVDGKGPLAVFETWCDMSSDGGGWTRFLHYSDPNGKTAISQSSWDGGIGLAAAGGIKQWLVKTYSEPAQNSKTGAKPANAWVLNLAAKVQGAKFTYFKHQVVGCNKHRYEGTSYVDSAKLLAGSQCKSLNYTAGRHLWGEHKWCDGKGTGWMWFTHCGSPSGHLLYVNYGHDGYQTKVLTASIDKNGAAYEFFFR